jgi:hypothetical protein
MAKKKSEEIKKGEIVIYKSKDGPMIDVRLEEDSVWLDAHLLGKLFDVDRTVVVKHIGNIYKSDELDNNSTCAKIAQVAADGRIRKMNLYNLDMIISVGYRVNSKRATQFRIWATKTLKNHIVKGYTINEKHLLQAREKFNELTETIEFLKEKSSNEILANQQQELLSLLSNYSKTLSLLVQYDKGNLALVKKGKEKYEINYDDSFKVILKVKDELISKKEASDIFGQERDNNFKAIVGNIYQTFGGVDLYPSLEEKAAHLLYFIIKDHPFNDGNKRIEAFLFIYYLDRIIFFTKNQVKRK